MEKPQQPLDPKNISKVNATAYGGLPLKHISEAAEEALHEINVERGDEQNGLYCSWTKINRGMGKYWRFNHVTQIAAPSGHGKSYTINQLHDDFTDTIDIKNPDGSLFKAALNKQYHDKVVIVHFGLEMDASDEVIRNLSRKIGKSHNYLLSSEAILGEDQYNKISDKEYANIENRMNYVKNRPIYYVEMTGTTVQMYNTVAYIRILHPGKRIVVSLDHSLLVKRSNGENSDMELIAAVGYLALRCRKDFKAMVIILGQLNQNIKSSDRIMIPALHYPMDSDIYMGSQINWVCDNIWVFPYRPELINIPKFGVEKLSTERLVVASCIKSRKGRLGVVYLREELAKSRFIEESS